MRKGRWGRGNNPNSHNNKPKLGLTKKLIGFTQHHIAAIAAIYGNKNFGKSVRQLVDMGISLGSDSEEIFSKLPLVGRARLAIEMLLEGHPNAKKMAESVLSDLEDLEIESAIINNHEDIQQRRENTVC